MTTIKTVFCGGFDNVAAKGQIGESWFVVTANRKLTGEAGKTDGAREISRERIIDADGAAWDKVEIAAE